MHIVEEGGLTTAAGAYAYCERHVVIIVSLHGKCGWCGSDECSSLVSWCVVCESVNSQSRAIFMLATRRSKRQHQQGSKIAVVSLAIIRVRDDRV